MFPNIHSLEESIQFFVFGIIIFTKFQRRQPSRFLLGGKKVKLFVLLGFCELLPFAVTRYCACCVVCDLCRCTATRHLGRLLWRYCRD